MLLAAGVLSTGLLLSAPIPKPIAFAPVVLASVVAFGRWDGDPLYEWIGVAFVWAGLRAADRTTWFAALPRHGRDEAAPRVEPSFPPPLAGLVFESHNGDVDAPGIIVDQADATVSVVLRVRGRGFALHERAEQDRLLQAWGDALASLCTERPLVSKLCWTETTLPSPRVERPTARVARDQSRGGNEAHAAYRALVAASALRSTHHETLVSITVERRRVRPGPRQDSERPYDEDMVLEQARLLTRRLDAAGLIVDAPLTTRDLASVCRSRLDPFARSVPGRTLADLAGFVSARNAGPLAVQTDWDHVRVDRSLHSAYVISEWPRLDMPASWLEPLVLHATGIRTLAVHYEPVRPSSSQRQVDRDSVRLASDEAQRSRSGFRIRARHRRAESDVHEREADLVAGYAELEYVGFVIVSAADPRSLAESCAEHEQLASQAGVELRRLDGRHDVALACLVPFGRGVASPRFR